MLTMEAAEEVVRGLQAELRAARAHAESLRTANRKLIEDRSMGVGAALARRDEAERAADSLRESLRQMTIGRDSACEAIRVLERERDEARAEARSLRDAISRMQREGWQPAATLGTGTVPPGSLPEILIPLREFVFSLPPGASVTFHRGD